MRGLRQDERAENLTALLIIIAAVFVVSTIVIGLMSPLFLSGTNEQEGVDPVTLFGTTEVSGYWNPTAGFTTNWTDDSDYPLDYPNWIQYPNAYDFDDYWAVSMLDVRNNTLYDPGSSYDFEKYYDMLLFKDDWSNTMSISYSDIENETVYEYGAVYAIFYPGDLVNSTTAVIIEFADYSTPDEVNEQLWLDNVFTVYIVYVTSYAVGVGELSWWEVAWQIATFQYTLTGTVFDQIFSALFDMMLLSVSLLIFSRIVHGGG